MDGRLTPWRPFGVIADARRYLDVGGASIRGVRRRGEAKQGCARATGTVTRAMRRDAMVTDDDDAGRGTRKPYRHASPHTTTDEGADDVDTTRFDSARRGRRGVCDL